MIERVISLSQLNSDQQKAVEEFNKWWNKKGKVFLLVGAAGTGKTFITKLLLDSIDGEIAVSAPTHKAKKVIENATGYVGQTIQSLLGLRPDEDLEKLSIKDLKFAQKGEPRIKDYKLVAVDESSMLSNDLRTLLYQEADRAGTKLLIIGDKYQLPPINEESSSALDPNNADGYAELRMPARQKPDTPLPLLLFAFRADIGDMDSRGYFMQQIADSNFGLKDETIKSLIHSASTDFKIGSLYSKIKELIPSCLIDGKGFKFHTNNTDFNNAALKAIKDNWDDNPEYSKVIAFTNNAVGEYNKFIRYNLFNGVQEHLVFGDRVMGYKTITVKRNGKFVNILTNSEEYSVESTRETISNDGIRTIEVELQNELGVRTVVHVVDPYAYKVFIESHDYYLDLAKKAKRSEIWAQYYGFKNGHLVMNTFDEFQSKSELPNKDLDYAYGLTVHKSQGSTYDEVFVDNVNIKVYYQMAKKSAEIDFGYKKISENEMKERIKNAAAFTFKLMYVAASRPRYAAHFLI